MRKSKKVIESIDCNHSGLRIVGYLSLSFYKKTTQTRWLKHRHLFLKALEAGKSKIRKLHILFLVRTLFLACFSAVSSHRQWKRSDHKIYVSRHKRRKQR